MKQEWSLEGLDCPNCAAKIEAAVQKLDGVRSASLNLVKQTLFLEADQDMTAAVERIVHTLEPDVRVLASKQTNAKKPERSISIRWIRLGVGGLVMAAGLLIGGSAKLPLLVGSYLLLGYDVVSRAVKNIFRGRVFDENFLMSLSTLGAFAIGEYPEAVAVMLLYQLGELFQDLAVQRSRWSVAQLMDLRPDAVSVSRAGDFITVPPEEVAAGETILVKPGEKLPLDGLVLEGRSTLDTRALTGESLPRAVGPGSQVLSGCINLDGVLTVRVTKVWEDSTVSKILSLVENAAAAKAPTENFITTFARYYTPVVVILALLLGILPPLLSGSWITWLERSFVFLVVSCPCALVISVPLTFFGGIGAASRHGILVKGSNYLQALNRVDTVVFDKTGTLTEGSFRVAQVLCAPGFEEAQVLTLAARAEVLSNHPIAHSILRACPEEISTGDLENHREIPGLGISVTAKGQQLLCGSAALMERHGICFTPCQLPGTKVYVAAEGVFAGCILIADQIKADSKQALADLKKLGIRKTVMLTGDDEHIARVVAEELELDEWYAGLLPQDKVAKLEQLLSPDHKLAFAGDGVNDAPVLARADIGIAMGGLGSDAAIEAADVVLMTDELSRLPEAIRIARTTRRIVVQNIVFALSVKGACLVLGALGIAGMWAAVFADVGVTLLAVLNALRMLKK